MSAKAALKAAKSALDNGEYEKAIDQSRSVLSSDSQNHFARLFLARALEKQGNYDDAAATYQSAANSKPDDSQAWLGLCSVYEAQGSAKLDEYRDAAVKVAKIQAAADDRHKCQTTIDKLVSFTKQHGSQAQIKKVLELLLPGSPIFEFLEGRIPHPSHTYTRLAQITESEESQQIAKEIAERRTRIGARVGQVTLEVKREVFRNSSLETLYQQVVNWSNDDEIRREYEEKLLMRAYDMLVVLPLDDKSAKLDQILTLAEGMVIIHHAFQKAWDLVLETRDVDDLRELDANVLREYVSFFPDSGLGRILKGWMTSELSPFPPPPKEEGDDELPRERVNPEDRLLLLTEGLRDAERSLFAHRLVSDYYQYLEENESAVETARSGLEVLQTESQSLGMSFRNTRDALNLVLGTALVHHQAPRHHGEARRLFEDVLQRKPKSTAALIGLGLILEETEDYHEAIEFFVRALKEDKSNVRVGTELAWCRALSGDYTQAMQELEDLLQQMKADDPKSRDLRAQTLYRLGVCQWEFDNSKTARRDRNGAYARFLAAIRTNVNFAPPYTSLGFYYSDYAKDKKRARQCFQKAFELSSAEVVAAERLARSFANQGDWDIVEVIAQRVVDSGRARPPPGSKKKGISWPYSALGVVQMNKQEYQKAIVSFLAALRISPDDYQSYVGLGESYHNSGRYNSALRTFNYALEPHDGVSMKVAGETWFARYMLANVHRELGDHEEAIAGLKAVLEERPGEFGVLMSLLQTYVERSIRCMEQGLYGQAIESAKDAISTGVRLADDHATTFNLWKAIGDACATFSIVQAGMATFPIDKVRDLLNAAAAEGKAYETLGETDHVSLDSIANTEAPMAPSFASILACKRAIHSCAHDVHARAVAWYNLGWAEQRAYSCSDSKAGKKYLTAAVRCFKRAIELEAGNYEFWNALGVVTTVLNPKVAQHAFVRSLHLNELNAKVWANLGVLYFLQNDHELAHQAFGRAQSTDPDHAHAWLGEGLIALLIGRSEEALNHFTHAFEISNSTSVITKRQYAVASFDQLLDSQSATHDLAQLIQPVFALEQLRAQVPNDLPFRHLAALFLERVGNHAAAIEILTQLCSSAEAEYEASESFASLARFALAKSDLSRNQLSARLFKESVENAETALDLSSDAPSSGLDTDARRKLRLSCHLTAGLAQYNLQQMQDSIAMFKAALEESSADPDIVCSLVQVLWAQGGREERGVARDQLFACVEQHPEHIGAVTLLGAIALLDDDRDTAEAVRDDLLSLRTKRDLSRIELDGIETLLAAMAAMSSGDPEKAALTEAQAAIMLKPDHPQAWTQLAELSGDENAARMALKTAKQNVPPLGNMEADELARAFAGVGSVSHAQAAVFMAPWEASSWTALQHSLA